MLLLLLEVGGVLGGLLVWLLRGGLGSGDGVGGVGYGRNGSGVRGAGLGRGGVVDGLDGSGVGRLRCGGLVMVD